MNDITDADDRYKIPPEYAAVVRATLDRLNRSKFRSSFRLTRKDAAYAREKGSALIASHAADFIRDRLAPAEPKNDGKQTPMRGHPVFTAQHATATCCRSCLEKWHRIPRGRALTDGEIDFVVALIMRRIGDWLTDENRES